MATQEDWGSIFLHSHIRTNCFHLSVLPSWIGRWDGEDGNFLLQGHRIRQVDELFDNVLLPLDRNNTGILFRFMVSRIINTVL